MIDRELEKEIGVLRNEFTILAILGPRQSGKTTLSKKIFADYEYISLEDLDHREFAKNDPRGFLTRYAREVILDEVQRVPELISYLQTHADRLKENGKIVITGSHNFLLMEQISQSLAGRVGITTLMPFTASEIALSEIALSEIVAAAGEPGKNAGTLNDLLFSGMYPRIYDQGIRPATFYRNYIATYVERDVRQIRKITDLDDFMRFIRILAGRTGQELNLSTVSEECGISHNTAKEWVSVLEASFLVFRIPPYHRNYNKRVVKNPKIYFTDTGLVCSLLGIRKKEELAYHFLKGHIFETFVVNEFMKHNFNYGEKFELYFWRDNHNKKVDLIIDFGSGHFAVEIKSGETFQEKFFDGLKYWNRLSGNEPSRSFVVYGGENNFVRNGMNVIGWRSIKHDIVMKAL